MNLIANTEIIIDTIELTFLLSSPIGVFSNTFLIIIIIPLISAQFYFPDINLAEGANQLIDQTTKFGTPFFEKIIGEYSTSEFFFSKILLLILLIIIIKNVLEKTPIG